MQAFVLQPGWRDSSGCEISARSPDPLEALDGPRLSEPAPYIRLVTAFERILYRPMLESDVGSVPIACQGTPDRVRDRIAHLGSSAVLAFDQGQHVGQLQFRRYEAGTRSPNGVWDPLYWTDFDDHAPDLPPSTLCLGCYHVGQLHNGADRDERYQGRGVGARLLDSFLDWARAGNFEALIAKATPPYRPVMGFLGGLPTAAYETRGFETVTRWVDTDLALVVRERNLVAALEIEDASTVTCCVQRLAG
jgi:GNAT superfamily N-acetyltransferase